MKALRTSLLSTLLHHANREVGTKADKAVFYPIKERLLALYGKCVSYDVQHFEGKPCYCGNGKHYFFYDGRQQWEPCNKCNGTKWYRAPKWVTLARYEFGKYVFHKPTGVLYADPFAPGKTPANVKRIEGYIEHADSKCGEFALGLTFLLFAPRYWAGYVYRWARWYRGSWYRPRNWCRSLLHLLLKGPWSPLMIPRPSYQVKLWKWGNHPLQLWWKRNRPWNRLATEEDDLPF